MGDKGSDVIFCRLCLRIDITLKYILSDIAQRDFMEKFFQENGCKTGLDELSYACFECRAVLHRSYNFLQKALRAQKVLYELQEEHELLTDSLFQNLDREQHNITSNLACCEFETLYILPPDVIKLKDNNAVKSEPNDLQADDLNKSIDSDLDQNKTNIRELVKCDNKRYESNLKIDINWNKVNLECIKDPVDTYKDPICNGVDKIDSEVYILDADTRVNDNDNYLQSNDPLENEAIEDQKKIDSDIVYISSDESIKFEETKRQKLSEFYKRIKRIKEKRNKEKSKKKKKDIKKPLGVRKKYPKVVWPKQPVLEERFRTRKNMSYTGIDDLYEDDVEEKEKVKDRRRKKINSDDEDFLPCSEDSSDDSYDDEGRPMKRRDTREFPMNCEACDGIITSRKDHQYHYLAMHRDVEYPYKLEKQYILCPECGKSVDRRYWKDHENLHAGRKPKCGMCHKRYSTRHHMVEHQRRVHGVGRRARSLCDICDMAFFGKADLIRHIRTHTGEKPYKCHLCDHRVAHKGNLTSHIRQFHQHLPITSKNTIKTGEKTKKKKKIGKRRSKVNENSDSEDDICLRELKERGKKKTNREDQQENDNSDESSVKGLISKRKLRMKRKIEVISPEDSIENENLDENNEVGESSTSKPKKKMKKKKKYETGKIKLQEN